MINRLRKGRLLWISVVFLCTLLILRFALYQTAWAEWGNAYWLLVQQRESVRHTGLPSFFVASDPSGVAYPNHIYYAGMTLALMGYLSLAIPTWFVFCASLAGAYALTMTGFYWIAGHFADKRSAMAISVTCLLSPYVVTNLYGRGAWAETIGVGAGVFLLGAVSRIATKCRLEEIPRDALRISTSVVFAAVLLLSTHNISSVLTLLFLIALLPVIAVSINGAQRLKFFKVTLASLAIGSSIPAVFLFPNLATSMRTLISSWSIASATESFDNLRIILSPVLKFPQAQELAQAVVYGGQTEVRLFAQTSVYLLVVGVVAACIAMRTFWREATSSYVALLLIGILVLMTNTKLWDDFPSAIRSIQFPYRLHPYLLVVIALFLSLQISRLSGPGRLTVHVLLVAAMITTAVLAGFQVMTAIRSAPATSEVADYRKIDGGSLPPVWAEGTAPPVQFRWRRQMPINDSISAPLQFDKFGHLLPTVRVDLLINPKYLTRAFSPLVIVGTPGKADVLGIGLESGAIVLIYDKWGQAPVIISTSRRPTKETKIAIFIRPATKQIAVHTADATVAMFDNTYGLTQPLSIGENKIGASTVSSHLDKAVLVSATTRLQTAELPVGRYKTNVVSTDFVQIANAKTLGTSSDGFLVIETQDGIPRWKTRWTVELRLGALISSLGIMCYVFLLFFRLRNRGDEES